MANRRSIISESDKALASVILARRIAKGLSQSALAQAAGVTFQQVQKYENGTNRIAASRLAGIAEALDVSVPVLLEDGDVAMLRLITNRSAFRLAKAFALIADENTRLALVTLVEGLAEQ